MLILKGRRDGGDLLTFSPDGSTLVARREAHGLQIWRDLPAATKPEVIPHLAGVGWMAFAPDGRQLYLAGIQTESHFENFCEVLERTDLLTDARFATGADRLANREALIAVLDELFASRDLADWIEVLRDLTTPWTVIQTAAEAAIDPQVVANGFVTDVDGGAVRYPLVASPARFDGVPPTLSPAPAHGEHTDEVLAELGRSWDEIIELKRDGAVL